MEPAEPLHRLGRRRPDRAGGARGRARRADADRSRAAPDGGPHVGPAAGDPHRRARAAACERSWIPVRRSWRLNERHYGALQGKDKKETSAQYGEEQVKIWRRSYDVPPEPLVEDPWIDERYDSLPPDAIPRSECLADVVARMLPYWYDAIVPDLAVGRVTLVAAHGNSLRGARDAPRGSDPGGGRRAQHPDGSATRCTSSTSGCACDPGATSIPRAPRPRPRR